MSIEDGVRRFLEIDRRRIHMPEDRDFWRSFDFGIVFVYATWSGKAQIAFRTLNHVLASSPELRDVDVYIIDSDTALSQEFMSEVGDHLAGAGETYWIYHGQVLSRLAGYTKARHETLVDYTRELLSRARQTNANDE